MVKILDIILGKKLDGTNPGAFSELLTYLDGRLVDLETTRATIASLTSHTSNTSNPHSVTKTQVGLSNVDNTSDVNKPVSTAQQTALNLKANLASPALSGTPTTPTATVGSNNTQIANTAHVYAGLALKENIANKNVANGYAGLDASGKIPLSLMNDVILGQVRWMGLYSVVNNIPALPATPTEKGVYYICTDNATRFGLEFENGDWIISDGTAWCKVDNTDAVSTVAGKKGNVVLVKGDVGLGNVDNTSDANKPISTLQAAEFAKVVYKVAGKDLSDNNFTAGYKALLDGATDSGVSSSLVKRSATGDVTIAGVLYLSKNGVDAANLKIADDVTIGDVGIANTFGVRGVQDPTSGYMTFGSDYTKKLGRIGTGPLTWGGDYQVVGAISAGTTVTAPQFVATTVTGANAVDVFKVIMGDNDAFRIRVGATATDGGYAEIATGDNNTEPIYISQYQGGVDGFTTLTRRATILDASGNTQFPGSVTSGSAGFVGKLTGNADTATAQAVTQLTNGANLNSFITPVRLVTPTTTTVNSLVNAPVVGTQYGECILDVIQESALYLIQIFTVNNTITKDILRFKRQYRSGVWCQWIQDLDENNVKSGKVGIVHNTTTNSLDFIFN